MNHLAGEEWPLAQRYPIVTGHSCMEGEKCSHLVRNLERHWKRRRWIAEMSRNCRRSLDTRSCWNRKGCPEGLVVLHRGPVVAVVGVARGFACAGGGRELWDR